MQAADERHESSPADSDADRSTLSKADSLQSGEMGGRRPPLFGVPGQIIILGVALLWGTNPPALRYLYTSDGACAPAQIEAAPYALNSESEGMSND